MTGQNKHIVIVGAGQAGGHAAMAARKAAPEASIVLFGDEEFPPYERPPLSKNVLTGATDVEKTYLHPAGTYETARIDLRLSQRVRSIDRAAQRLTLESGDTEPYDSLILATGASARRLSIPGGDARNVFYLRGISDCLAIRGALTGARNVVVVGAGLIGLEIAASARQLGCDVTVLEAAPRPLQRVMPSEISRFFVTLHAGNGVDLRFDTAILSIEDLKTSLRIETSGGSIDADLVVVGIGSSPNQHLAEAAGITVDDGVLIDTYGRSSDPRISAAGDVARQFNPLVGRHVRLESWQNAQNQGIAVGRNAANAEAPHVEVPWFWSDQFGVNFQSVGWLDGVEEVVTRGTVPFTAFYLGGGRLLGASSADRGRDIRFARNLIRHGCPVDAAELADEAVSLADICKQRIPAGAR